MRALGRKTVLDEIIKESIESLSKNESRCVEFLCEFLHSFEAEAGKESNDEDEILCEFEDMDQYYLSPTFRYIDQDGEVSTGVPRLTKEGERFFKDSGFMPDNINERIQKLWESAEDEEEFYRCEEKLDEKIKEWLRSCWEKAVLKTNIKADLYYCKHHWNYKTINLRTGVSRELY
jgi:hypothetical protein